MTPRPTPEMDVRITRYVWDSPGVLMQQGAELIFVPEQINAAVRGLPWEVALVVRTDNEDQVPEIEEVRVTRRPGGVPVASDVMRGVRLGEAKDRAVALVARRLVQEDDGTWRQIDAPAGHQLSRFARRPSRRVTEEIVRKASDAYRQAKQDGRRDCLVAIVEACNVSRATAARYRLRGIEAGLIEEED